MLISNICSSLLLLQDFLTNLVCNLLEEGNTLFKDGEWERAVREFSEGLNVSRYGAADDIRIPAALLESLYVNRAAAYYSMVREHFLAGCKDLNIYPSKCIFLNRE